MSILFLLLVLILSTLSTIEPTNFKKSYSRISEKHDQTSMHLTLYANFRILLCLMKSNGCVPLRYILHKSSKQNPNLLQRVVLTPSSPFDVKCKKLNLMQKTSGNIFLGHLGGCIFHIFQRLHSIMRWGKEGGGSNIF